MSQVLTPDQLVNELRSLSARISKGVSEVHNLELDLAIFSREYDWAKARAMLAATGTVEAKKAEVELAVATERVSFDTASAAFNYAKGLLKSLESAQMSTMAQLRAVESTYRSAGRE
jgi:hypothetical protein